MRTHRQPQVLLASSPLWSLPCARLCAARGRGRDTCAASPLSPALLEPAAHSFCAFRQATRFESPTCSPEQLLAACW